MGLTPMLTELGPCVEKSLTPVLKELGTVLGPVLKELGPVTAALGSVSCVWHF